MPRLKLVSRVSLLLASLRKKRDPGYEIARVFEFCVIVQIFANRGGMSISL